MTDGGEVIHMNIDSLFERFAIMTIDGEQSDADALEYCRKHTTPELAAELEAIIRPRRSTDEPRTPEDVLTSYLQKNIELIPSKDKRPLIAYTKEPERLIRTADGLKQWTERGITEYGFIPSKHNLLVIDIDRGQGHANQADGIANIKELIAGAATIGDKIKRYFDSFPDSFPCYTTTPSGGLHLYFRASYITPELAKRFDNSTLQSKNIELKYNTKTTAAGSETAKGRYIMTGSLERLPEMTLDLLNVLIKAPERPPERQRYPRKTTDSSAAAWNTTPEGIIQKATEKYSGMSNHEFIYKTAILFQRAGMTKAIAEQYIKNTPQHRGRSDKHDTTTAIDSIYR